jgi:hypothetical protein
MKIIPVIEGIEGQYLLLPRTMYQSQRSPTLAEAERWQSKQIWLPIVP